MTAPAPRLPNDDTAVQRGREARAAATAGWAAGIVRSRPHAPPRPAREVEFARRFQQEDVA